MTEDQPCAPISLCPFDHESCQVPDDGCPCHSEAPGSGLPLTADKDDPDGLYVCPHWQQGCPHWRRRRRDDTWHNCRVAGGWVRNVQSPEGWQPQTPPR